VQLDSYFQNLLISHEPIVSPRNSWTHYGSL